MDDTLQAMQDGFAKRLADLADRHEDLLASLRSEEARQLGEQGAEAAIAPLVWSAAIGERWPTNVVTEFLHVTRQALHKRIAAGTALGLPGRGTTWFPVWQFDLEAHQIRTVVAEIVAAFRAELGSVDPYLVASWATTVQRELDMTPEAWIAAGNDTRQVVKAAKRAARDLGR